MRMINKKIIYNIKKKTTAKFPSRLGQQNTPTVSLQSGKTPHYDCPVYDSKQFDGEVPVMLELWEMRSTPL